MHSFLGAVEAIDSYLLLGLFALWLVLFVYAITISRRLGRLTRRQTSRLSEGSIGEVTDWLSEHSESIDSLKGYLETMSSEHREQMRSLATCLQKVGMVRFNAFEDIGGEQSFAIVLLDANNNGVAISSLYGRQDSRLYAKGIVNGEGERPLSDEEQRALSSALSGEGFARAARTTAG